MKLNFILALQDPPKETIPSNPGERLRGDLSDPHFIPHEKGPSCTHYSVYGEDTSRGTSFYSYGERSLKPGGNMDILHAYSL